MVTSLLLLYVNYLFIYTGLITGNYYLKIIRREMISASKLKYGLTCYMCSEIRISFSMSMQPITSSQSLDSGMLSAQVHDCTRYQYWHFTIFAI